MLASANIYTDADGVLCVEVAAGCGDAIKLRSADECMDFLVNVATEANRHFGTAMKVFWHVGELSHPHIVEFVNDMEQRKLANDLARKLLDLPADCDTLAPPTFEERHAANEQALQEIHQMVWGDGNV